MLLQRHPANPILTTVGYHDWEDRTCFNAAVVYEDGSSTLSVAPRGRPTMSLASAMP